MKKVLLSVLSALMLCFVVVSYPLCAGAEAEYWICWECGQGSNTGEVCSNCGLPRSNVNENLTRIPGETDHVQVNIHRIDGSSFIVAKKNKYLYAPENAIDEDSSTCWRFSSKKGLKNKAWLAMIIEGETIDEIWILNGNQAYSSKGKYQYPLYSRLKKIRVNFDYYDDRERETLEFTLSDKKDGDWKKLDVGRHENVDEVVVYIDSIYKGKSYATTVCLSEFMLVQNAPADTAVPRW